MKRISLATNGGTSHTVAALLDAINAVLVEKNHSFVFQQVDNNWGLSTFGRAPKASCKPKSNILTDWKDNYRILTHPDWCWNNNNICRQKVTVSFYEGQKTEYALRRICQKQQDVSGCEQLARVFTVNKSSVEAETIWKIMCAYSVMIRFERLAV